MPKSAPCAQAWDKMPATRETWHTGSHPHKDQKLRRHEPSNTNTGEGPHSPVRGFQACKDRMQNHIGTRTCASTYAVATGCPALHTGSPLLGKHHPAQRYGEQRTGAPQQVTLPRATINLAPAAPVSLRNPSLPQSTARALPSLRCPRALVNCHPDKSSSLYTLLVSHQWPLEQTVYWATGCQIRSGPLATGTLPSRCTQVGSDILTPHLDLQDPNQVWQGHWHQPQVHLGRLAGRAGLRGHCIKALRRQLPRRPWSGRYSGPRDTRVNKTDSRQTEQATLHTLLGAAGGLHGARLGVPSGSQGRAH